MHVSTRGAKQVSACQPALLRPETGDLVPGNGAVAEGRVQLRCRGVGLGARVNMSGIRS